MEFKYRYVGYGTNFVAVKGYRLDATSAEPRDLYENEVAVDVGGVCLGYKNETLAVLDHHFFRDRGQFPSAAAATLHLASLLYQRFGNHDGTIWIVTHRDPDFDAYCAMYLVRSILCNSIPHDGWAQFGLGPEGWEGSSSEVNWFRPETSNLPPERRAAVLLAAYAACVDHCRQMSVPKHRSLRSVLYAALKRGRSYANENSGAKEFFDEAYMLLCDPIVPLNPLFDSIFEHSRIFAPELSLLERESYLYERDLKRARKVTVFLPRSTTSFTKWFAEVKDKPVLRGGADGSLSGVNLPLHQRVQADGVFIRDPECMLFKEWARLDIDNSSMGEGFLFTAIAFSNRIHHAIRNDSEYYFSLDPERAGSRHLYPVWSRLQSEEIKAMLNAGDDAAVRDLCSNLLATPKCRSGYEKRADKHYAYFDDPWFDGSNYECTIVATPNRGSLIGASGTDSDLSDDPIASIVQDQLENCVYISDVSVAELSTSLSIRNPERTHRSISDSAEHGTPRAQCLRFCSVQLDGNLDLLKGQVGKQIGRTLWSILEGSSKAGLPLDFESRHLVLAMNGVWAWNRRGIVVAYKPAIRRRVDDVEIQLRELAETIRDFEQLVNSADPKSSDREAGEETEHLMRRIVALKRQFMQPDNRILQRFFEACGLEKLLETLRDVNGARNLHKVTSVQRVIHVIEYIIVAYYVAEAWHIFHPLPEANGHLGRWNYGVAWAFLAGIVIVEAINRCVEGHWPILHFIRNCFKRK